MNLPLPQRLRVMSRRQEAQDVVSFGLSPCDGDELSPFSAGAHIDIDLPVGLRRSYSLCSDSTTSNAYRIAVHRSPTSRGGSSWIHEELQVGAEVSASLPLNDFPLAESAISSVFVAGGIGITPVLSMVSHLTALGSPWTLHYAVRTRALAAFVPELEKLAAEAGCQLDLHVDDERGQLLDIEALVRDAPPGSHFYACGPPPMLDAFLAATATCGDRAHVERFAATEQASSGIATAFDVHLAKSDLTFRIEQDRSILATLLAEATDLDVNWSCGEGICGTCELRVLSGTPLHRDSVLSEDERTANRSMMICVSRTAGERLVLDL